MSLACSTATLNAVYKITVPCAQHAEAGALVLLMIVAGNVDGYTYCNVDAALPPCRFMLHLDRTRWCCPGPKAQCLLNRSPELVTQRLPFCAYPFCA
jgi:hypothetical protein